jgi:nucleotide-binding universal stress UspA family protein
MVKILAAMDPAATHFNAGVHALNLAKRIKAKVMFLLVYPPSAKPNARSPENPAEASVKQHLAALIEEARSDGITVEYYVAYGQFENELVSFVHEKKITLLVVESPPEKDSIDGAKGMLEKIRHRIDCLIEVVNEKPETSNRKE